ncbi:MAG: methionyl-tRNA formyltransferase, partial [Clostridia bacterium]|nr:methionyl-tRNA formyltransferase [Clostridia bacterium]
AKEDCIIDFTKTASEVRDLIRGLSPFPGALTTLPSGKLLKVTGASLSDGGRGEPGEVISADGAIRVACREGAVDLTEVVPEGKGRMDAASFIRGRGVRAGDKLGAK